MALHRFKPGVSGNPAGRPPKVTTFLRHAEVALLKDLEKRALEGDAEARRELFDRIANDAGRRAAANA